jgi:hypothetical protein
MRLNYAAIAPEATKVLAGESTLNNLPTCRGGGLGVLTAILVTVVAIVVGFAAPTSANDRPSDPFGNHTIELDNEAPLFEIWESLRDKVLLDKAHFHSCIESNNESNKTDCHRA